MEDELRKIRKSLEKINQELVVARKTLMLSNLKLAFAIVIMSVPILFLTDIAAEMSAHQANTISDEIANGEMNGWPLAFFGILLFAFVFTLFRLIYRALKMGQPLFNLMDADTEGMSSLVEFLELDKDDEE